MAAVQEYSSKKFDLPLRPRTNLRLYTDCRTTSRKMNLRASHERLCARLDHFHAQASASVPHISFRITQAAAPLVTQEHGYLRHAHFHLQWRRDYPPIWGKLVECGR